MIEKRIVFSLYGYDRKYYVGAYKNLDLIKSLLPDWDMQVAYHPEMTNMKEIRTLNDLECTVVDIQNLSESMNGSGDVNIDLKSAPMFWRFIPMMFDGFTMVRDLDSRFTDREIEYIHQWEENKKKLFIIRDHPWHSPIPGGLIGTYNGAHGDEIFTDNFEDWLQDPKSPKGYGADQDFLFQSLRDIPDNNKFYCGYDDKTNYIPRTNKDEFIGMQIDENEKPIKPGAIQALDYLKSLNL